MTDGAVIVWEPYRPSNGTEGDLFRSDWCDRCEHDRLYRETGGNAPLNADGSNGCSILARTLGFEITDPKYPKEWRRRADSDKWPDAECTAFLPEGESVPDPRCTLTKELFA